MRRLSITKRNSTAKRNSIAKKPSGQRIWADLQLKRVGGRPIGVTCILSFCLSSAVVPFYLHQSHQMKTVVTRGVAEPVDAAMTTSQLSRKVADGTMRRKSGLPEISVRRGPTSQSRQTVCPTKRRVLQPLYLLSKKVATTMLSCCLSIKEKR